MKNVCIKTYGAHMHLYIDIYSVLVITKGAKMEKFPLLRIAKTSCRRVCLLVPATFAMSAQLC